GTRMISLKALEQQIIEYRNEGKPLPPSVMFMAGLQRIEYVIVSPDTGDIIVAGPGEGFKTNGDGLVVGAQNGMPVIHLEDFLVAMRHVQQARTGHGISVSIDPTETGTANIRKVMKQLRPSTFDENSIRAIEEAGGAQMITLTGVPKDSRFSNVLVSADYKMKRLAMGFEESPEYLPNIFTLAERKNSRTKSMSPRFWMETSYEPMSVSEDKLVWKLNGQGVCTKTQEEVMLKSGEKKIKRNKLAETWAETMTEKYESLCRDEPIFQELRNLMDLSVVAAVIEREHMLAKVGLDLPAIKGMDQISLPKWNVPQNVPTQCSYAFMPRLMVTASGGVTVDSWAVAAKTNVDSKLNMFGETAIENQSNRWWWNAN
ncbi:MAG: DUF1598 domain-containing protein, partial [Planctomycetota bacterium]